MTDLERQQSLISDLQSLLSIVARMDDDQRRREIAAKMLGRLLMNQPLKVQTP